MAEYTPMIEQYLDIKKQYKDAILMFRLGDFYEMFFEDAQLASHELEIVLTARDGGASSKIPMCGVPFHAVNNYISKLINRGYKVAICDQMEDPKLAKGIVKREVTHVITPGTVLDTGMLDDSRNNYLAAVIDSKDVIGFSYIDITTGDFWVTEINYSDDMISRLEAEFYRLSPAECLLPAWSDLTGQLENDHFNEITVFTTINENDLNLAHAERELKNYFGVATLEVFGLRDFTCGTIAAGAILSFLNETQKSSLKQIQNIKLYNTSNFMDLDYSTRRNLELTAGLRDNRRNGTLLQILDYCLTSMGKRLLRNWIEQPLIEVNAINQRLDAVEELTQNISLRESLPSVLDEIADLERLCGRIGSEIASPRDLLAVKRSLAVLPQVKELISGCSSAMIKAIAKLDTLIDVYGFIDQAVDDNAPLALKEGGIIKTGFDAQIDELRLLSQNGSDWLMDYESKEKARTGIKYLKVGFNKVFGYYIEVSNSNLSMVPPEYIRKQTLVNTERFITEELKKYEDKILGSREKLFQLEYEKFTEIRTQLLKEIPRLQLIGRQIATLDVLLSLSRAAFENDYTRPEVNNEDIIDIKAGRHPVVEKNLHEARFVPNDLKMNRNNYFALITGPNMGGKSTYMRQAALLVLMAQMGSFIPADHAVIGVADRIFTRVGASDDLNAGQSTFMVEMAEVANILNNASSNSLIILDEIGRGTSTYDGLSIAQAVTEYLCENIKARTLFATHYHELTKLADAIPGLFNLCVSVMESGDMVVFLKKVLSGKADRSYGIHVAQLAGLPRKVVDRANNLLAAMETDNQPKSKSIAQLSLFDEELHPVMEELQKADIDNITPREALGLLYRWKGMI
ncbi:MAG TPA: DNA mismatch repair protein MutS [Syntrophomonadaceae bacterium]|nr:DNA mismatch repair protein MutS [Syntrophomonadaceae bacterium]